jgi:hypothetical protein
MKSGNIPTGCNFFFDQAQFNEAGTDDFEVYIGLFVEGNMGISYDQFWKHRASAYGPFTINPCKTYRLCGASSYKILVPGDILPCNY